MIAGTSVHVRIIEKPRTVNSRVLRCEARNSGTKDPALDDISTPERSGIEYAFTISQQSTATEQ